MCEGPHPKNNWDRMRESDCGACKYLLARHREISMFFREVRTGSKERARALLKTFVADALKHFEETHPEWPIDGR